MISTPQINSQASLVANCFMSGGDASFNTREGKSLQREAGL